MSGDMTVLGTVTSQLSTGTDCRVGTGQRGDEEGRKEETGEGGHGLNRILPPSINQSTNQSINQPITCYTEMTSRATAITVQIATAAAAEEAAMASRALRTTNVIIIVRDDDDDVTYSQSP